MRATSGIDESICYLLINFGVVALLILSIFNKPVTFNQWQNIQIESLKGTYKTRAYITSRFHLFPIKKLSLYNALNYYQKKSLRKYKVHDFLLTTRTFLNFWELKKEQESLVDMLESMKKDM